MKQIRLSSGVEVTVDNEDYGLVKNYKWYLMRATRQKNMYVFTKISSTKGRRTLLMHRLIMNPPKGAEIDHIDGNGLNNQKENLRICTHKQNTQNSKIRKDNTSGFKGVSFNKHSKKWKAYIQESGKQIPLGYFASKEKAYEAYCLESIKKHGDYAPQEIKRYIRLHAGLLLGS